MSLSLWPSLGPVARLTGRGWLSRIHPGYGFLSENAEFAAKVEKAGLIFVGPQPEVIDGLGDKIKARQLAIKHNVPVVPGTEGAIENYEDGNAFVEQ